MTKRPSLTLFLSLLVAARRVKYGTAPLRWRMVGAGGLPQTRLVTVQECGLQAIGVLAAIEHAGDNADEAAEMVVAVTQESGIRAEITTDADGALAVVVDATAYVSAHALIERLLVQELSDATGETPNAIIRRLALWMATLSED